MSIRLAVPRLVELNHAKNDEEWLVSLANLIVESVPARRMVLAIRTRSGRYLPQPVDWSVGAATPARVLRALLRGVLEEGTLTGTIVRDAHNEGLFLEHDTIQASTVALDSGDMLGLVLFDAEGVTSDDLRELLLCIRRSRKGTSEPQTIPAPQHRYERLVEHSDAILFHTDREQHVLFISRRALDFFGLAPDEFIQSRRVKWIDLLFPEDAARMRMLLNRQRIHPQPLDEEVRMINRITGKLRWVLIRLVPVLSEAGELTGWDGFGIDVSMRREAQSALDVQSKKIRALYTVASAIRGYLDPSNIAVRGLAALCDATGAHAGICYLYPPKTSPPNAQSLPSWDAELEHVAPEPHVLESIALYGFPEERDESLVAGLGALAAHVAETNQSLVVPDLCTDPRAGVGLVTQDALRSAVLVPVAVEDEVLGVVGLFSHQLSRFDGSSIMLVSAASNQIGLAARQANLFALYRKQTKYLSALYRMSHELSQHHSLQSLFENAFAIIREELGLKRLWLGLLNDAGTRLIGQAAYGPGWRRQLIDVSVDVVRDDHALGRVVASKKPLVIQSADELYREFGVKRLFSRMSIHAVALVPIMSGTELLGVLAVQPGAQEPRVHRDQIHLLMSLAAEIGVCIQTLRFASQTREAEKMRASSLLAAGIAHNFNNSLQAILGQASLLEMQSGSPERVKKAATVINEAATKAAGLVRQLLAFTQFEEPKREALDVKEYLVRNRETFRKLLTDRGNLQFQVSEKPLIASFDPSHLTRILNALLQNAREAMPDGGELFIRAEEVEFLDDRTVLEVPPGRYVKLSVRDTGRGMSDEAVKRCFEPFYTTKNVDPGSGLGLSGSGLGLATAYILVRRNGGRILAESQLGGGSTFTLYLPIHVAESELKIEKFRAEEARELPAKKGESQNALRT